MQTPDYMVSNGWRYLGPCLPPGALANDAPAMLEALQNIILCHDARDNDSMANAISEARALIAKHMELDQ
jgi:hypothetical protein